MQDPDAAFNDLLSAVAHTLPDMAARITRSAEESADPSEMIEYAAACAVVIDIVRRHPATPCAPAPPEEVLALLADLMIAALIAARSERPTPPAIGSSREALLERFSAVDVHEWLVQMGAA